MPNPLSGVTSWLYLIGGFGPAKISEVGASRVDMVVVDQALDSGAAFSTAQVDAMAGANDKLVISYLSIGEAETYRDYWQAEWETTPPDWIGEENPEWAGNIKVAYWDAEWQAIVFDMIDSVIASGFDGIYLDIIDAYYYWEDLNGFSGGLYRDRMVDFVTSIRAYADDAMIAAGRGGEAFAIIGQNGEDLAEDPDYLAVIDGIGKEDLYFYYPNGSPNSFGPVPGGWLTGSKELLEIAQAAGVEIFTVEYVPAEDLSSVIGTLRQEITYLESLDSPLYLSSDRALRDIEISIWEDGVARFVGTRAGDDITATKFGDAVRGGGGKDVIKGLAGHDWLSGGQGNDVLRGGAGNDKLVGNGGRDRAHGGQGADIFIFRPDDQKFILLDFETGIDRINLSAFGFAGFADLETRHSASGDDLNIALDGDTLVLKDTVWSDLGADDFIF